MNENSLGLKSRIFPTSEGPHTMALQTPGTYGTIEFGIHVNEKGLVRLIRPKELPLNPKLPDPLRDIEALVIFENSVTLQEMETSE